MAEGLCVSTRRSGPWTTVDAHGCKTSGAKRQAVRIQQLRIILDDEDVVLPRVDGQRPRDGCKDVHMGALTATGPCT